MVKKKLVVGICVAFVVLAGVISLICMKPSKESICDVSDAIEYIKVVGLESGFENAASELSEKVVTTVEDGDCYYRLQQNYKGIPVFGRTAVCVTDQKGDIISITGNILDVDSGLNLTPTISVEQINNSIQKYFEKPGYESSNVIDFIAEEDFLNEESLCIYNMAADHQSHLAYQLYTGGYKIIVDAHNGEVLSCSETLHAAQAKCYYDYKDERREFTGYVDEDNTYVLKDVENDVYIYDAGKESYWELDDDPTKYVLHPEVLTLVRSEDTYFGNDDDNVIDSKLATAYLYELVSVKEFCKEKFNEEGKTIIGIYNDRIGTNNGKNAGGGLEKISEILPNIPPDYDIKKNGDEVFLMTLGYAYNNFGELRDLMAHEYMHAITDQYVDWGNTNINLESAAIREGISDIFGEIYEASRNPSSKADWINGKRVIKDPSTAHYPERVGAIPTEKGENGVTYILNGTERLTDYAHGYSTVISHAAYLMQNGIDGKEEKQLSLEQLGKLWYRAVSLLPATCTFNECGQYVVMAAREMEELNDKQIECIKEAFEKVGISVDYKVSSESTISVYDVDGQIYGGNLQLHITGTVDGKNSDDIYTMFWGTSYERYETIFPYTPYQLNLEDGIYRCTITSEDNPEYSYSIVIHVNSAHNKEDIEIKTKYEPLLTVNVTEYASYQEAYDSLIQRYKIACSETSWFDNQAEFTTKYSDLNLSILDWYHTAEHYDEYLECDVSCILEYGYFDIDGNGIPELVLASGGHERNYFDIYTFSSGKLYRLFSDDESIYTNYSFYTNGIISQYSSERVKYYRISDTGDSVVEAQNVDIHELLNVQWITSNDDWTIFAEDIPVDNNVGENNPQSNIDISEGGYFYYGDQYSYRLSVLRGENNQVNCEFAINKRLGSTLERLKFILLTDHYQYSVINSEGETVSFSIVKEKENQIKILDIDGLPTEEVVLEKDKGFCDENITIAIRNYFEQYTGTKLEKSNAYIFSKAGSGYGETIESVVYENGEKKYIVRVSSAEADEIGWASVYDYDAYSYAVEYAGFSDIESLEHFNVLEYYDFDIADSESISDESKKQEVQSENGGNDSTNESTEGEFSKEEIEQLILEHYYKQNENSEYTYTYTITDMRETEYGYFGILYYVLDENPQAGYHLATGLYIDTTTGEVTDDWDKSWNFFDEL